MGTEGTRTPTAGTPHMVQTTRGPGLPGVSPTPKGITLCQEFPGFPLWAGRGLTLCPLSFCWDFPGELQPGVRAGGAPAPIAAPPLSLRSSLKKSGELWLDAYLHK